MGKIFINDNQIEEWVEAAEGIRDQFRIDKALGYVIGEKFYNLVSMLHVCRYNADSYICYVVGVTAIVSESITGRTIWK